MIIVNDSLRPAAAVALCNDERNAVAKTHDEPAEDRVLGVQVVQKNLVNVPLGR